LGGSLGGYHLNTSNPLSGGSILGFYVWMEVCLDIRMAQRRLLKDMKRLQKFHLFSYACPCPPTRLCEIILSFLSFSSVSSSPCPPPSYSSSIYFSASSFFVFSLICFSFSFSFVFFFFFFFFFFFSFFSCLFVYSPSPF
jgi:hypothetical protein